MESKQKVVLLENEESDLSKISSMLNELGCEVIMSFDEFNYFKADYDAYFNVAQSNSDVSKANLKRKVKRLMKNDPIWLIDICWITKPGPSSDQYGVFFLREYGVKKAICMSLEAQSTYGHRLEGVEYICKCDSSGACLTESFKNQLKEALTHFRTDKKPDETPITPW